VSIAGRSTVPVVHRGLVLFAQNPENDTSVAEALALDVATGDVTWRAAVDGVYSPLSHGDAQGSDVVFVDERGVATMMDVSSGAVRWRSRSTYPQDEAHPVIVGDRVFLTAFETQALGFDRATGEILGKGPVSPPVFVRQETGHSGRLFMLVTNEGQGGVWMLAPYDPPSEA
jgi:outer membrane protein assembly factor BamB